MTNTHLDSSHSTKNGKYPHLMISLGQSFVLAESNFESRRGQSSDYAVAVSTRHADRISTLLVFHRSAGSKISSHGCAQEVERSPTQLLFLKTDLRRKMSEIRVPRECRNTRGAAPTAEHRRTREGRRRRKVEKG